MTAATEYSPAWALPRIALTSIKSSRITSKRKDGGEIHPRPEPHHLHGHAPIEPGREIPRRSSTR